MENSKVAGGSSLIRVLVTSVGHPYYNQTGRIVRDMQDRGVEILLDRSDHRTLVPEGQWKIVSRQEFSPEERERWTRV